MPNEDSKRLNELTVGDAKRILVYGIAVALAVFLFCLLIGKVVVALLLGVVAGVYLLPIQEWMEKRLRARAGSALITIALIVVPMASLAGYTWYEMSSYSNLVQEKRNEIIGAISTSLSTVVPISRQGVRAALEVTFTEALTHSAAAIRDLRQSSALLFISFALFFFTVFYVLTQRVRIAGYLKVRIPGEYLPLYEKLTLNIGGALRGVLFAIFVDQSIKGALIIILNFVFDVPLAVLLGLLAFILGFFPPLGEWVIYVPVVIYLFVFRHAPVSAAVYLGIGLVLTIGSSLYLRPRLASSNARHFNFYWMLVALIAGISAFGVAGIVLGPSIMGFVKAMADTLFGEVRYETSLLKSEDEVQEQRAVEQAQAEAANASD